MPLVSFTTVNWSTCSFDDTKLAASIRNFSLHITAHHAPAPRVIEPAGLTECDSVPALQPGGDLVTGPTKEPMPQGSITGPTKEPVPQGTEETPQVAQ